MSSTAYDLSSLLKDKKEKSKENLMSSSEIEFIDNLVKQRSSARERGDYQLADILRDTIDEISEKGGCACKLPTGYRIEVKDIPRVEGGGSTWTLQPRSKMQQTLTNDKNITVLGLAHTALGLASSCSDRGIPVDKKRLNEIVVDAKQRLLQTGEQELRGRKAADAAFWFALAGVQEREEDFVDGQHFSLFDALTFICTEELKRFGFRSSCRATDILHMIERIAASGINNDTFTTLQKTAAKCLESKNPEETIDFVDVISTLKEGKFSFHSERSLLWIWRFSTRQRKQRAFLNSAKKHWDNKEKVMFSSNEDNSTSSPSEWDWDRIFLDTSKSLVVDIGCGMGVSILGLSSVTKKDYLGDTTLVDIDWESSNFLGADLSNVSINFAKSIVSRWNLSGKAHFVHGSAEEVVEYLKTYPGDVRLIMLQFPTPYRFDATPANGMVSVVNQGQFNQQLPIDAFSGFMVSRRLLQFSRNVLDETDGKLLLQSNVEDVAVHMRDIAQMEEFEPIPAPSYVNETPATVPQRTIKWIKSGGDRAIGSVWSSESFLPALGATETEIACTLNGTPIHRILMKPGCNTTT